MKTFPKRVLLSFALLVAVGASLASITTIDLATMVRNKLGLANGGTNADLSGTGGANAFLAQAADHSISARHPAYTDITGLSTVAHTGAWSDLQDATGNLTLANGANATTFNQTSAVNWTWANTTAAIHLTSQSSPILNLNGTVYNGATSIADSWTIQNVVGNTDNGLSDLEFTHSGSSGIAILGISNGTDRVSLGSHSVSSGFPAIWLGIAAGSETLSNYSLLKVATGKTAINDVANVSVRINNSDKAIISGTVFELVSGMTLQIGGIDTGISRLGAASLAVGNGTAGDYSGSLKLTTLQMAASSGAPTSAGTAGTAGEIIYYSGVLYFCSVTGTAGHATWNILNMTVN